MENTNRDKRIWSERRRFSVSLGPKDWDRIHLIQESIHDEENECSLRLFCERLFKEEHFESDYDLVNLRFKDENGLFYLSWQSVLRNGCLLVDATDSLNVQPSCFIALLDYLEKELVSCTCLLMCVSKNLYRRDAIIHHHLTLGGYLISPRHLLCNNLRENYAYIAHTCRTAN